MCLAFPPTGGGTLRSVMSFLAIGWTSTRKAYVYDQFVTRCKSSEHMQRIVKLHSVPIPHQPLQPSAP